MGSELNKSSVIAVVLLIIVAVGTCLYVLNPGYSIESVKQEFSEEVSKFTEVAEKFTKRGPGEFCKHENGYDVNGDFFNIKENRFFINGGPLGSSKEVTYDNLLSNVHLTHDEFVYYKDFLDRTKYIECINLVQSSNFTGVEFNLPYLNSNDSQEGFLYISQGVPMEQRYKNLEDLGQNKWKAFKRN